MRILNLRFKNLNSLEGSWSIDFTCPQFQHNGLFVITGPTGSGKTTILDAISLAMYGRTPRLQRVNKNTNDIMTQGCGECFSEVTFSTVTGTYRSMFSQRRARGSATGTLQDQKREIADANTGKLLAATLKEAETVIEQVTGMTFDQFTRSVMLAQGQFAAFLQAGSDQRAPILEQITGTGIYSDISIAVQQRHRDEKEKLSALQFEVDSIQPLDPEEIDEAKKSIDALDLQGKELDQRIRLAEQAQRWYADRRDMARREQELQDADRTLAEKENEFSEDKTTLARYEKARPLIPSWKELQLLEESRETNEKEKAELEAALSRQVNLVEQKKKAADETTVVYGEVQSQANDLSIIIKQIRVKDTQISQTQKDLNAREAAVESYQSEMSTAKTAWEDLNDRIQEVKRELLEAETYLQKNERHALLATGLGQLFDRLESIESTSERLASLGEDKARQEKEVAAHIQELVELNATLENITNTYAAKKSECDDLLERLQELKQRGDGQTIQEKTQKLSEAISQAKEELEEANRYKRLIEKLDESDIEEQRLMHDLDTTGDTIEMQRHLIHALDDKITLAVQNQELLQYRDKLERGLPCPLCGSTEHPYVETERTAVDDRPGTSEDVGDAVCQLEEAKKRLEELVCEKGRLEALSQAIKVEAASLRSECEQSRTRFIKQFADEPLLAEDPDAIVSTYGARLAELRTENATMQEIVAQQESLNADLISSRKALDALNEQLSDARAEQGKGEQLLQRHTQILQRTVEDIDQLSASQEKTVQDLQETCLEMGIDIPEDFPSGSGIKTLKRTLQASWDGYRTYETNRNDAKKRLAVDEGKLEGAEHLLKQSEERLDIAQKDALAVRTHLDTLQAERSAAFGDKDCDTEESLMRQRLADAQAMMERAKETLHGATTTLTSYGDRISVLRAKIEDQRALVQEKEDVFAKELAANGFSNRKVFQDALIPDEDFKRLQSRSDELRNQSLKLESERQGLERHKREMEEQIPKPPYDDETSLSGIIETSRRSYEESLRQVGSLQQKLNADKDLRKQQETTVKAITAQRNQLRIWDSLYALIGSSDGKKFRNYAQGITFDMLLAKSNRKLAAMTDRYLLVRSQQDALDICVIDNYQAGEKRSTKNLSGGESFLISLALALGLSQMASKQVRVDSLFLDEGFGTLDAETLDTALDALSTLRDDGKLIGLISHVPALKERIRTQIEIVKGSGGRSVIQGPGCTRTE